MREMPLFPKGEPGFVQLLREHEVFHPNWADTGQTFDSEDLDVRQGIKIFFAFPDPEHLLDTARADFSRFMAEAGITGEKIPFEVVFSPGMKYESFCLTVSDKITLTASDTEGIRRGLYHLCDKIASSPRLKRGEENISPWLKDRISRCFFGPIKRPPFNVDELMNDIDYYPEEYLSRLASEGTNGLWLTIEFKEICDTRIRKAPPEAAQRLAKLRRTVEKCRRYGIKIWVFGIEPACWSAALGNPLPEGYTQLLGEHFPAEKYVTEMYSFCPDSETARQYLYDSANFLFKEVPHLGGMITISYGERLTSCFSILDVTGEGKLPCPECKLQLSDAVQRVLEPLSQGIRDASPDAGLISWLYMAGMEQCAEWIYQIPEKLSGDITLCFNFESGLNRRQNGRVAVGGDYWLSQAGPSDRVGRMSLAVKGHCRLGAKLQVASSHELATVPYIPVPSLLYKKYKKMKALGVSSVIQCWYFGNYPGLMNKAAGRLAFEDFSRSEEEFLAELASVWGKDAPHITAAWKLFAESYSNYPVDNIFQYYGPMHDGPVWPLYLKPVNRALTRSWIADEFPCGDAVGECMTNFSLKELAELVLTMSRLWARGVEEFKKADRAYHELEFSLVEALNIHFASAANILKFYNLRAHLFKTVSHAPELLSELEEILRRERSNSLELAELSRSDLRLGYHSEAEVMKYFPEKLQWRADVLDDVLQNDLPEMRKAIEKGISLQTLLSPEEVVPAVPQQTYGNEYIRWSFSVGTDDLFFELEFPGYDGCEESVQLFFMDRDCIETPRHDIMLYKKDHPGENGSWHASYRLPRSAVGFSETFRFGVERVVRLPDGKHIYFNDKEGRFKHDVRLIYWYCRPEKTRLLQVYPHQK